MSFTTVAEFSDDEKVVVRFIAERFHNGGNWFDVESVPLPDGCDESWRYRILGRLKNYGLIASSSEGSYDIRATIAPILEQMDNPPKPNYWRHLLEWWFASKWRTTVTAFVIILPLLVQWVVMIQTVLKWIGVGPAIAG